MPPARELLISGALAAIVVLMAVLAFYGADVAVGARLFFTHDTNHSDIWHLALPMKQFYQQELLEGRLPLWCPELGTGFPLHAQGQVGALYPANLVLYRLLPLGLAFNWSVLLHAMLAGAFAAMFCRQLGGESWGCILAGVVFALSGFFVTHVKHPSITAAAVWLPLLLLSVERYAGSRGWRPLLVLGVSIAAMLLAGHPQIAFYNLLAVAAWTCGHVVVEWRKKGGFRGGASFGAAVAYAALVGGLIAAPQLLPTRELHSVGPRAGGMPLEEATEWQYEWGHLVAFVAPRVFGVPGELRERPHLDPSGTPVPHPVTAEPLTRLEGFRQIGDRRMLFWEMTGYVGIFPLVLTGFCLSSGLRGNRAIGLLAWLVASLLLCLGTKGGLFYLFWYLVPGFDFFRFPSRFLLHADLALALLAGIGWTLLSRRFAIRRHGWLAATAGAAVILVCLLDLGLALGDHNPTIAASRWLAPPPSVERIERNEIARGERVPPRVVGNDPSREVFTNSYVQARGWSGDLSPYDAARTMLAPNLSLLYGVGNLEIFFPLYPVWMRDTTRLLTLSGAGERNEGRINQGIASLFGARYLLDAHGSVLRDVTLLGAWPGGARHPNGVLMDPPDSRHPPFEIRLFENRGVFPRAFLVPAARVVAEAPKSKKTMPPSVRALLAPSFDPRREVLIVPAPDEPRPASTGPGAPLDAPVIFKRYTPREVRMQVHVPQDSWLVLSDTYYPGWSATVNGAATPIYRANVSARAIRLEPGPAEVEFRYAPASFRNGLLIGALGLVLLAAIPAKRRLGASRRDPAGRRAGHHQGVR